MSTLILMATFNGESFVDQQIESIVAQTDRDWMLLISDDGSNDATRQRIERWSCMDQRIQMLDKDGPGLGPMQNFERLMECALARDEAHIAFCDQDDVWLPRKLERQLAEVERLEHDRGRGCPALVHTDLEVVDDCLAPIHPSLARFQMINHPSDTSPLMLLSQNHVVGCTMLINRPLLKFACPMPESIYMHDWWIALCASAVGVRSYLPQPLVRYRQHAENQVGARGVVGRLLNPLRWPAWIGKMNQLYHAAFSQACCLHQRVGEVKRTRPDLTIDAEWLQQIEQFLLLPRYPRGLRLRALSRIGLRRQNAVMTVLFYLQSLVLSDGSCEQCRRVGLHG